MLKIDFSSNNHILLYDHPLLGLMFISGKRRSTLVRHSYKLPYCIMSYVPALVWSDRRSSTQHWYLPDQISYNVQVNMKRCIFSYTAATLEENDQAHPADAGWKPTINMNYRLGPLICFCRTNFIGTSVMRPNKKVCVSCSIMKNKMVGRLDI